MKNLENIEKLTITNFRSISGTVEVPLDAPIILIHGSNGAGKTSILSALELALTGDIPSMRRDDRQFVKYLVHEDENGVKDEARVEIVTQNAGPGDRGAFVISKGDITGKPYLDDTEQKFFGERCYLAQSMLGRLLDIYQNSKAEDGQSALMLFVKDLLGLDQLDALVEGLKDSADKRNTKKLVPDYKAFEDRVERTATDLKQLSSELKDLDSARSDQLGSLRAAFVLLFGPDAVFPADVMNVERRIRDLTTDADYLQTGRRLAELQSISKAWGALPEDADAQTRVMVETNEEASRAAAHVWRQSTGAQLEEVIMSLRSVFPDLPSWSSTNPESAYRAALDRVEGEQQRLSALLAKDSESETRESGLTSSLTKDEARSLLIDTQIAGIAKGAGEFARALAGITPHVHSNDCPVCGRDFSEYSPEPLAIHLQQTISRLTEDAGRLSALSNEKTASVTRIAQLKRDIATLQAQRISSAVKQAAAQRQADMNEAKTVLDRLSEKAAQGTVLLTTEAQLRNQLALFRERDRLATDLLSSIRRIAVDLNRASLVDRPFDAILTELLNSIQTEMEKLQVLQRQRNNALLAYQEIVRVDQRRKTVSENIAKATELKRITKAAIDELEALKNQAKVISETASHARTAVVRRVFNESLNTLWRDLFVRLAPTEPFVPSFRIPESDADDIATLETVHRSGAIGGAPGAMLSAGNLNTAALTLFLALHFSVGTRLPWLVLDDPVQNMDEVHVAQFAALLRTLSRTHGTKVIIAVHERTLFEYLKLELSPAFEKDRLLTVELRRTQGKITIADSKINTYQVDAVAA